MTTYKAVPNTDGQILVPIGKKPPGVSQPLPSRTMPPPRRPHSSDIPTRRLQAPARPQSSQIHRPVHKSGIRSPEVLRPRQRRTPNNNLNEGLENSEAAASRWHAVNDPIRNVQSSKSHVLDRRIISGRPKSVIQRENAPVKIPDHQNVNKMSLAYIMGNRPSAQNLTTIPEEREKEVLDLAASSESEDEYESEFEGDEEEEMILRPRHNFEARDSRYPSFSTDDRISISNNASTKHDIINPSITNPLQNSLLNTPVNLERVEKAVKDYQSGGNAVPADSVRPRSGRRLPPISATRAVHHQIHPNIISLPPFTSMKPSPKATTSPILSTLEHVAVNTLASLNQILDSSSLISNNTFKLISGQNTTTPINESPRVPSLKRVSSLISTGTPTPTHTLQSKSPVPLSKTESEPVTKKIRISSLLSPTPSLRGSASTTPRALPPSMSRTETSIHDPHKRAKDSEDSTLTSPPPSEAYLSPPESPSLSSPPSSSSPEILTRTIPKPLIPRTLLPKRTISNPQPHSLIFNKRIYSPLPSPSSPHPRAVSAPPPSPSAFPPPHFLSKKLSRKDFAYRAWKLRPTRSILNGTSPSHTPQYLVIIRNDKCSSSSQDPVSPNVDGEMGKWWGVINGKEDMEEIRKLFE